MANKRISQLSNVVTVPSEGAVLALDVPAPGETEQILVTDFLRSSTPPPTNPEPTSTGNYLKSGGYSFVSNLTVEVSLCFYVINNVARTSPQVQLTASAAHATLNRIDVIALNSSNVAELVEGTPAASPVEPSIDPATQLRLGIIYVAAAQTVLTVTEDVVYREGSGGEWTDTASGAGVDTVSTGDPHLGSNSIKFTAATAGQYALLTRASSVDITNYNILSLYVKAVTWASAKSITVQAYLAGVAKGVPVSIRDGNFSFSRSNTTDDQLVVIDPKLFGTQGILVDQLRFTVAGGGTALTCYIDDIVLQAGPSVAVDSTRLRDTGAYVSTKFYEKNDLAYSGDVIYKRLIPGQGEAVSSTVAWVHFAYRTLLKHLAISFDPKIVCDGDVDRLFLLSVGPDCPNGLNVIEWRVSFEADPTTEVDLDLKRADAFIGVANAAVMDVLDTTTGASSEATSSNINGGVAVANGKVIYLEFGTAYTEENHQVIFQMWYRPA